MNLTKTRRGVALSVALCCGLAGPGCKSDSTVPTHPTQPSPPVTTQVTSGNRALPAHHFLRIPFTTGQTGTLTVKVQWTYATNVVWVDVAAGDCAIASYQASQCEFLVASNEAVAAPQKTVSVSSFAGGTHTLIIDDRGPDDESLSYQVTLTS